MNILNAIGRSDLYLKVDLLQFPIIIFALIVTIPYGVKAMVIGQVVSSVIGFFIYAYLPGKFYGYGAYAQIKDFSPIILITILSGIPVYFVVHFFEMLIVQLILGGLTGLFIYLTLSYIFKIKELFEIKSVLLKLLNRKTKS